MTGREKDFIWRQDTETDRGEERAKRKGKEAERWRAGREKDRRRNGKKTDRKGDRETDRRMT